MISQQKYVKSEFTRIAKEGKYIPEKDIFSFIVMTRYNFYVEVVNHEVWTFFTNTESIQRKIPSGYIIQDMLNASYVIIIIYRWFVIWWFWIIK